MNVDVILDESALSDDESTGAAPNASEFVIHFPATTVISAIGTADDGDVSARMALQPRGPAANQASRTNRQAQLACDFMASSASFEC